MDTDKTGEENCIIVETLEKSTKNNSTEAEMVNDHYAEVPTG